MSHGFHSRAVETVGAFAVRCLLGGELITAARLFGAAEAARSSLHCTPGPYGRYWAEQQARLRRGTIMSIQRRHLSITCL